VATNQSTLDPLVINLAYPPSLSGPGMVTIPNGATTTTFSVTGVDITAPAPSAALLIPALFAAWSPTQQPQHFAELMVPCCESPCAGVSAAQTSQSPCLPASGEEPKP
jgi:hypothetical protein